MTNRSGYCTVRISVVQRLHKFYYVSKREGQNETIGLLAVVNNAVTSKPSVRELLAGRTKYGGGIVVRAAPGSQPRKSMTLAAWTKGRTKRGLAGQ